jgi:hypothetical protein
MSYRQYTYKVGTPTRGIAAPTTTRLIDEVQLHVRCTSPPSRYIYVHLRGTVRYKINYTMRDSYTIVVQPHPRDTIHIPIYEHLQGNNYINEVSYTHLRDKLATTR